MSVKRHKSIKSVNHEEHSVPSSHSEFQSQSNSITEILHKSHSNEVLKHDMIRKRHLEVGCFILLRKNPLFYEQFVSS